jgi:ABC-type maltose transport system permease subunit
MIGAFREVAAGAVTLIAIPVIVVFLTAWKEHREGAGK